MNASPGTLGALLSVCLSAPEKPPPDTGTVWTGQPLLRDAAEHPKPLFIPVPEPARRECESPCATQEVITDPPTAKGLT